MESNSWLDRHLGLACVGVAALYALGSELAWHSFGANVGLAFFPPAGLTVTVLLLTRRRNWPALLATVFATETAVDLSQHLAVRYTIVYALANTVEPLVGALAVQRLNPFGDLLDRRRGKLSFLGGACAVGPFVGALIGATAASFQRPGTAWLVNVAHWWSGDGIAVVAIGATLLLCATVRIDRRTAIELVLGGVATAAIATVSLTTPLAPATLALPTIVVLALRIGPVGATVSGTVFAIVANYSTAAGHGYFAELDGSASARLAYLQVFIAVLVVVGWSVGIEVQARARAVAAAVRLERQRDDATAAVAAIQRALAPQPLDNTGPLRVGSCYQQSDVDGLIGGDWYDVFELPDGRILCTIGDVVGHGLDAVQDMAHLRLASRALACEGHPAAQIAGELSRYAHNATHGRFATVIVAVYRPDDRTIALASAGHPPPLLWRAASSTSTYLPVHPGPPLGVQPDRPYQQTTTSLDEGDLLVLYTDGVVERRDSTVDDGLQALRCALDRCHPGDIDVALNELAAELTVAHTGGGKANDDRCLLVIHHCPAPVAADVVAHPLPRSARGTVHARHGSADSTSNDRPIAPAAPPAAAS